MALPKLPQFQSEQEESDFWDTHDSTDYFHEMKEVDYTFFVDVRPKNQISLHFTTETIDQLKSVANKKGIGYEAMIRVWVMERLAAEV